MPAARAQPSGDLHTTKITPLLPPPPVPAWLCCQCPAVVVGRGVSIVPRVSGFQGQRAKGFQGLNGFKGTKGPRASGFQGIEGFPMLTGAFKGLGVSNIRGIQGSRDPGLKGFHGQNNFKGTKVPRASGFQGIEGFPMLTGAFKG